MSATVELSSLQWRLVVAAINAARSQLGELGEDTRLSRPSGAGIAALKVCLSEYETICNEIIEQAGI